MAEVMGHTEKHLRASAANGESISRFLHRMDSVKGDQQIVATTPAALRRASFLDGREVFWNSARVEQIDLADCGSRTARLAVFHVGFCGSTLLARMLDDVGGTLMLKEPQCLADLAGQRRLIAQGAGIAPMEVLADYALRRLGDTGGPDTSVVLKPTNWVNSILSALCGRGRVEQAVFLTMARRAYLAAVFRGGRDRIEFCTRLAAEIAAVIPGGDAFLSQAVGHDADPLNQAARIIALLHAMQERMFADVRAENGWAPDTQLDFAELIRDPAATVRRAQNILGLPPTSRTTTALTEAMARHAKDPSQQFQPDNRAHENAEVERHHAARFDAADAWVAALGIAPHAEGLR